MKLLGPKLEPLGLHITRAALVDTENRRSATGTHLAVYVEPDGRTARPSTSPAPQP